MKQLNVKMKVLMVHVFIIISTIGLYSCFDKSEDPAPQYGSEMRHQRPPHQKGNCNRDEDQDEEETDVSEDSDI